MGESTSFVEDLVKQTCRRAAYECESVPRENQENERKENSIYSLEFLKSLHDNPKENVQNLFRMPKDTTINGDALAVFNLLNDTDFARAEKKYFLDFLNTIKDKESNNAQRWSELRHFMHYAYRNFISTDPNPQTDALPDYILNEMRRLKSCLWRDDESQIICRTFALLRDYCIYAHWNFANSCQNELMSVTKMFYYYEAMLAAAKNLNSVFTDFKLIMHKNYSVCWIDFNTYIFIHYFFQTSFIQNQIFCVKQFSPSDSPAMLGLLGDLKELWTKELRRVNKINDAALRSMSSVEAWTIDEHKTILKTDFWIDRQREHLSKLQLDRLDHHVFRLVGDKAIQYPDPIIDESGCCVCEECLISKYKALIDSDAILNTNQRLIGCHRCHKLIGFDFFHIHVEEHLTEVEDDSKLDDKLLVQNGIDPLLPDDFEEQLRDTILVESTREAPMSPGNAWTSAHQTPKTDQIVPTVNNFSSINSELKMNKGKLLNMLVGSECEEELAAIRRKRAAIEEIEEQDKRTSEHLANTKAAFEEFMKTRKDSEGKGENNLSKNVRNFIKIKKDIFNHPSGSFGGKIYDSTRKEPPKEPEPKVPTSPKVTPVNKPVPTPKEVHCDHSNCKLDPDDLKSEFKKAICQTRSCEHHKEKKCDCNYCEVFGTVPAQNHKNNELRDRLRIRLHQRREKRTKDFSFHKTAAAKIKQVINKVEERVPAPTLAPAAAPVAEKPPDRKMTETEIHGLLNYIEGITNSDKIALAEKKAAKKARQRVKKEEERLKAEEEQKQKEREARRLEFERKKAEELARQQAEKEKLNPKKEKKKKQRQNKLQQQQLLLQQQQQKQQQKQEFVEETIPAMVTIKRVIENDSAPPTVTITLKGSTPDQDKLLYTLVNGADEQTETTQNHKGKNKQKNEPVPTKTNKKKKNKAEDTTSNSQQAKSSNNILTKELKVTLALDPSTTGGKTEKKAKKSKQNSEGAKGDNGKSQEKNKKKEENVNLPLLRLPPGITITKVEGPLSSRNYKTTNMQDQQSNSTINVSKSGVIVVDTEKLIQQTNPPAPTTGKSKRGKKKKNKKPEQQPTSSQNGQQMITLKNPIFQSLHRPSNGSKPETAERNSDSQCAPAAIFTSENGMVTIRSSRLQQSLNGNSMGMSSMLSDLKPVVGPDLPNSYMPTYSTPEPKKLTAFNAQEILSGLPGIEITKVEKRSNKPESDSIKPCQTAQVSIIPAGNDNKFNLDKDDWTYDSVFAPREILEDDMDAEERELEAFKRFCQQSVPPKRKEKVAHLNVKDIILKKKSDANCA